MAVPVRILVVDDYPDTARSLAVILETQGYEAKALTDPREAIAVAKDFRPAVACLDIGMPALDGFQLARLFRSDPDLRSVCLIAISAWDDEITRRRTAECGFQAHALKPVKFEALSDLIARCLQKAAA